MNEEYLIHYGIKGMKWGVRRQRKLSEEERRVRRKKRLKTAAIVAGVVAGTAVMAYGTSRLIKDQNVKLQMQKGKELANEYYNDKIRESVSITGRNDGSYTVNVRNKINSPVIARGVFNDKAAADRYANTYLKGNDAVVKRSTQIYNEAVSRGINANTREAARNLINERRKRKRSR